MEEEMKGTKPDIKTKEFEETKATFNSELHRAIHALWNKKAQLTVVKEELDVLSGHVVTELKKAGKDFIRVQIDHNWVEAEIKRSDEKLVLKAII
jgi:hypothetical protein